MGIDSKIMLAQICVREMLESIFQIEGNMFGEEPPPPRKIDRASRKDQIEVAKGNEAKFLRAQVAYVFSLTALWPRFLLEAKKYSDRHLLGKRGELI